MAKSRSVNIYFNAHRAAFPTAIHVPPDRRVVRVISVIKTSSTLHRRVAGTRDKPGRRGGPKRENSLNCRCSVIHFIRERITSSRPFIGRQGFRRHPRAVVKLEGGFYVLTDCSSELVQRQSIIARHDFSSLKRLY